MEGPRPELQPIPPDVEHDLGHEAPLPQRAPERETPALQEEGDALHPGHGPVEEGQDLAPEERAGE